MERHPSAFQLFSATKDKIATNILDPKQNRLVASDQSCWGAINLTAILI